ncbi:insulin-like growth factor-binding protein 2 [Argopecten irradians]|uniref:insulin-like growth factor-binding protein 2 n=1 Tax=Argopecten irradians TaxID=31199 RepID=UPI00371BC681
MLAVVVLVASLGYVSAIVCTPELCQGVDKDAPLNCAGSVIKNGGFCGCTDACAKVEGEACQAIYMFGLLPAGRCDDGLECVHANTEHSRLGVGTCQKKQDSTRSLDGHAQTACEQKRAFQQISFVMFVGQWMAKCDANGNFQPKQCDNQQKCFCVDIHSGNLLTERQLGDVDCSAYADNSMVSRDLNSHTTCQQARMRELISMVVYAGKWVPVCDFTGNYVSHQCDNQHKCFCVDTLSGKLLTERQLGDVDCSAYADNFVVSRDLARHAPTTCEQARSKEMLSMVVYEGQWFPVCDSDGNFLSRQCDNQHKCFCVDNLSGKLMTERQLGDVQCSGTVNSWSQ